MNFKIDKKLIFSQFSKFFIVGLAATGIHYGVYLILLNFLSLNIAYSLGYLLGFLFNFQMSAVFTFKSKASAMKALGFTITNLINYGLHILFLNIFVSLVSEKIAPILVYSVVVPINFILVRFVFISKIFK